MRVLQEVRQRRQLARQDVHIARLCVSAEQFCQTDTSFGSPTERLCTVASILLHVKIILNEQRVCSSAQHCLGVLRTREEIFRRSGGRRVCVERKVGACTHILLSFPVSGQAPTNLFVILNIQCFFHIAS